MMTKLYSKVSQMLRLRIILTGLGLVCLLAVLAIYKGSCDVMVSTKHGLRLKQDVANLRESVPGHASYIVQDQQEFSGSFREKYRIWDQLHPMQFYDKNSQSSDKYLIYNCDSLCGGWADRLKGFIVTYIVANLTGRAFKMQILEPHCNMQKYLVPNRVNWTFDDTITWERNLTKKQEETKFVNLMWGKDYNLKKRVNQTNFLNIFVPNVHYFFTRTNQDYLSGLKDSCIYQDELSWMRELGMADVYAAVYKRLFKLAPRLENHLQNVLYENLPTPQHRLVCVHVRLGHEAFWSDWAKRNSIDNLPNVWAFVRKHSHSDMDKVFVMSDSNKVIESARNQSFRDRVITFSGEIIHIDKFAYHGQSTEQTCNAFERLLLEHHMLMNCDVLMMSHSGLSNFASFIRGSDKDLYCLRDEGYIEPCSRNNFTTFT